MREAEPGRWVSLDPLVKGPVVFIEQIAPESRAGWWPRPGFPQTQSERTWQAGEALQGPASLKAASQFQMMRSWCRRMLICSDAAPPPPGVHMCAVGGGGGSRGNSRSGENSQPRKYS